MIGKEEKAAQKIIDLLRRSIEERKQDHYLDLTEGYDSRYRERIAGNVTHLNSMRKRLRSYYRGDSAYRGCRIEQLSYLHRLYRSTDPHVQGIRDRLMTDTASAAVSIMRFIDTMGSDELLDHGV